MLGLVKGAVDTGSATTLYVDAPVTPETSYYYAVRARSAQGLPTDQVTGSLEAIQ